MRKWLGYVGILFLQLNLFGWSMLGSPKFLDDVSLKTISNSNILWVYQDKVWKTNIIFKNTKIKTLKYIRAGEGFWSKNDIDIDLSKNSHQDYKWQIGWNFVSPINNDWDLHQIFDDNNSVNFGWRYEDNQWKLYSKKVDNYNFPKFSHLSIGEGAWFYYMPKSDVYFGNQPLLCQNGSCQKVVTSDKSFLFKIKPTNPSNNMKIAFDLYRYSNKTHYRFAFGPFGLQANNTLFSPTNISVCVEKKRDSSCKTVQNSTKFAFYKDGFIYIDSQKIASIFNKSIPTVHENFRVKLYTSGFDSKEFVKDSDFGTIGIEGFGVYVSVKNNKSISFELELK